MSLFLITGCNKDNGLNNNSEPINIVLTKAEENIAQNEINFSLRLLHRAPVVTLFHKMFIAFFTQYAL